MSNIQFTDDEFQTFSRLSKCTESRDQVVRIRGRLELRSFIEQHGKAKCDAMWARICASEKTLKRARAH